MTKNVLNGLMISVMIAKLFEFGLAVVLLFSMLVIRNHIFQRNVEFWAEPRNLPISAEFLYCFCGVLQTGDQGTNVTYFVPVQAAVDN